MKKIWIVGSLGHMGQALIRLLDMMEYELYETDKDELDITDEHAVSLFMHRNRPDVVINCAGYHPSAGAGQEHGILHIFDSTQGKCSGETTDTAHYFGTHGLLHILLHQFYRLVACFDVYSSFLVIHFLLISAAGALSFY